MGWLELANPLRIPSERERQVPIYDRQLLGVAFASCRSRILAYVFLHLLRALQNSARSLDHVRHHPANLKNQIDRPRRAPLGGAKSGTDLLEELPEARCVAWNPTKAGLRVEVRKFVHFGSQGGF